MLYTLEQLVKRIRDGEKAELKTFHGIMTYIDRFLETFHHPKEDIYLLPVLKVRHPDASAVIDEIFEEHRAGHELYCKMLKSLSAFEFSEDLDDSGLEDAVLAYTAFERNHALREEKDILPLAEKYFSEQDWVAIDTAFSDHDDPLFGKNPTTAFRNMFSRIVSLVPAPEGLGPQWKVRS